MIDNLLNLLFRCSHRRLTRPVSPATRAGQPHSQSYVVCLDCGKQFEYDTDKMRIGKRLDAGPPRNSSRPPSKTFKYAIFALPGVIALGAIFKPKKLRPAGPERDADPAGGGHRAN